MAKFGRTLVSHDLCEHRIARQSRGVALAAANTVAIRAAPATVDRIPLMLAMLVATRRIKPSPGEVQAHHGIRSVVAAAIADRPSILSRVQNTTAG
jgi:hypothetical protein